MKNFIISLLIILCFSNGLVAQDFQGKATYKTSSKMSFKMEGKDFDPAMQKQIEQMMTKQSQKEYSLVFDAYSSLYTLNQSLEASPRQQGEVVMIGIGSNSSDKIFKSTRDKTFTSSRDLFGKPFLVKDTLKSEDWKLTKETKQIGHYTCYKATYDREQSVFQSISVDNEEESETETTKKTITVEAWYTPDIPVGHGPGMYWGLPGLVMEIQNGNTTVICTEVILNPEEKIAISAPTKGKVITEKEFEAISNEKMEEMQKMYKGGKKKGDGHTMSIQISG